MTAATRTQIMSIIGAYSGHENVITIPRVYIEITGDYAAAALLNQILYWSERTDDPEGWFYKSYREWQEELSLSQYQINRIIDGDKRTQEKANDTKSKKDKKRNQKKVVLLRDLGVETIRKKSKKGVPTLHYRINEDVFVPILTKHLKPKRNAVVNNVDNPVVNNVDNELQTMLTMNYEQSQQPLRAEITTETTPEINNKDSLRIAQEQDKSTGDLTIESAAVEAVVVVTIEPSSDSQKLDIVQEAEKHLDGVGAELPKPKKANKKAKPRKPREPDRIWNGVCLMSFKMDPKSESPVVEAAIEKNRGRIGKVVSFLKNVGATPEELFRFYRWYQTKYPHLEPPKDDAKFSSNWSEFKEGDPTEKLSSRPSHKKVTATQTEEISPEDQAAALAHMQSFKLEPMETPPIVERAAK